MNPPALPVGAHMREQHVPPQSGTPPVVVPQIVPFGRHSVAPGALAVSPHTPSAAPAALVQLPPQQSAFVAHASPVWTQNETPSEQMPPLQSLEQHWSPAVHGLPEVRHVVLSGLQTPPPLPSGTHEPLQQSAFVPHASVSATHCLSAHLPPRHENVQHSLPVAQATPGPLHWLSGWAQT